MIDPLHLFALGLWPISVILGWLAAWLIWLRIPLLRSDEQQLVAGLVVYILAIASSTAWFIYLGIISHS